MPANLCYSQRSSGNNQTLHSPGDIPRGWGLKSPDSVSREQNRALHQGNQNVGEQVWIDPVILTVEEQSEESRLEKNTKRPEHHFKSDDASHLRRI
jgi:hypothetical protein